MAQFNPVRTIRTFAKNSPWIAIAIALHAMIIAIMSVIYLTGDRDKSNRVNTNVHLAEARKEIVQPPEEIVRKAPPKNAEEEVVDYEHEMTYTPTDEKEDLTKEVGDPSADTQGGPPGGTAIGAGTGPGHWSNGVSTRSARRAGKGQGGRAGGPTQGTEKAVREGLLWLMRHQLPDGSWDATQLPNICVNNKKCVDAAAKFNGNWHQGLTGLALLAFLGAGYNFDSKQYFVDTVQAKKIFIGPVIKNGLLWMKKLQQPDGSFGPDQHVYNQALCALALSEAYGFSKNITWKEPAQRAIDWLVRAQKTNPDGSGSLWGWRYHSRADVQKLVDSYNVRKAAVEAKQAPLDARKADLETQRKELEGKKDKLKPEEYDLALKPIVDQMKEVQKGLDELKPEINEVTAGLHAVSPELYDSDMSVTTWVIMAFKSAEAAGLTVPRDSYLGGKAYVLEVSQGDGLVGYQSRSKAGQVMIGPGDNFKYHVGTMSALSMLCRTFVDHDIDDPFLEKAAQQLIKDMPEVSKDKLSVDYYYWYYASLALNQFDGPDSPRKGSKYWDSWNRGMQDALLGTQDETEKACTRGGWIDGDRWSMHHNAGPIYSTAINVLTLEVYYRYENAFGSGTRFDTVKKPSIVKPPSVPPSGEPPDHK